MPLSDYLRKQAVLALVASDYAYKNKNQIVEGASSLKSFPDSRSEVEQAFPQSLLSNYLFDERDRQDSPYHSILRPEGPAGLDVVEFDNWVVDQVFQVPETGFGAVLFRSNLIDSDGKRDYIVAFRGTDGLNLQDWFANLDLGRVLWERNGNAVIAELLERNAKSITFAGQSLGGGLAQYALYDYVRELDSTGVTNPPSASLVTFNGFGAVRGLRQLPGGFSPDLVKSIPTAHFVVSNDIVHRLGAGSEKVSDPSVGGSWHLNGKVGNVSSIYEFAFVRYDDNGVPVPHTSGRGTALPGLVEAHRIEPGFYRGFKYMGGWLGSIGSGTTIAYLDTADSQSAGAGFSRLFGNGLTNEYSAGARLAAGLIAGLGVSGNIIEIRRLAGALAQNLRLADDKKWAPFAEAASTWTGALAVRSIATVGAIVGDAGVMVARAIESADGLTSEERAATLRAVNSFLPRNKKIPENLLSASADQSLGDRKVAAHAAMLVFARSLSDKQLADLGFDALGRELVASMRGAHIDSDRLSQALTNGAHWVKDYLNYVGGVVASTTTLTTPEKQRALLQLAFELATRAKTVAAGDQDFVNLVGSDINEFLGGGVAVAIARANPDVISQQDSAILLTQTPTFQEVRELVDAFLGNFPTVGEKALALLTGSSSAEAAEVERQSRDIQEAIRGSAQAVVVREQAGAGPTNPDAFDANSTVIATGIVAENGSHFFTLYLPYPAGKDGQRILLTAVGEGADKLRLDTGEVIPNVNGTFTVTVPEGTKQLVLAFGEVGDIDADSTIEIKAQLIDASGNPTHNEHLELTLTLDGEAEVEIAEAPGPTSVTVLGDLHYQEFTDVVEATGGPVGGGFTPEVPRGPNEVHIWTSPGFVPGTDWVNLEITDATYQVEASEFDPESGITTTYYTVTGYTVLHNSLDELGNVITDSTPEPDQAETLFGGAAADLIDARGGDDNVQAKAGDDTVYAGTGDDDVDASGGNDWVEGEGDDDHLYGDEGDDRLIGGAGVDFLSGDVSRDYVMNRGFVPDASTQMAGEDVLEGGLGGMDMLIGGGGRDSLYAAQRVDTDLAIEEGETAGPSGERGDWLVGGAGDDTVVGAQDNEALFGGSGGDLIVAGAGDDHVDGDQSYISEFFDWTITEIVSTVGNETTYSYDYGVAFSDGDSGDAGDDRIYAGAGNDIVVAGGGDDFVEAGSGNDKVWGHAGSDIILGGDGDDLLHGDNSASVLSADQHGSDFIDGGAGNDDIKGDGGNDALYGGDGDDFLQGDTIGVAGGDDYLNGEAGNDTLSGNGGADVLVGGAGDDELFGDSDDTPLAEQGADELVGGEGDDWLQGYGGDDMLDGGSGLDELFGGAGADRLMGGDGNDRLFGEDGTGVGDGAGDTILGGLGDDEIRGEGGNDIIDGGGGADIIGGDDGDDVIYGGLGNDQLVGGEGDDSLKGDGGDDIIFGEAGADDIDGGAGNDQVDAGEGIDRVAGGDGDDTLLGGADADDLFGDEGNDILLGGDGFDFLDGGAGNDHLQGGSGIDTYVWDFGSGEDRVADDLNNLVRFGPGITRDFLSLGVGSLLIRVGGENALHIEGFDAQNPYAQIGISELQFSDFDGNVVDTMTWSELIDLGFDLVGTPDPDFIAGTNAVDRIFGLEAQDWLQGAAGDDVIYGGEGNDTILGGDGADTVYGEDGDDNIEGGAGRDTAYGDAGDDVLSLGEGDDVADGGEGNDTLAGGEGADVLQGSSGNDDLSGDAGDDELVGGEGADVLRGGAGADALTGGLGDDTYVLEDGLDTFAENADEGEDTIVATFDYALGAGTANVENLALAEGSAAVSATGDAAGNFIGGNENDNLLYGLDGDDVLVGSAGHDLLDGGAGADAMFGGNGDDTYLVDSEHDIVQEQLDLYHREVLFDEFGNVVGYGYLVESGGYDSVESTVSFALDQWTEALVLMGTDAIDATGNVEWNYLQGNDADNTLYAYRLNGEADTYPSIGIIVQQFTNPRNAAEEMLQDKANVAIYRAEFPWFIPQQVDLYAGAGDELYGMGGNDRLFGGLDNDHLYGEDGDDLLYGFAGSDTMAGGAGDDTYVVSGAYSFRFNYVGGEYVSYEDEGTDDLFEAENEGVDTVYSEVDFALPEHFENLTLVVDTRDFDPDVQISRQRFGHMAARVGEGNALANVITANDGGNELHGYEGNDTLNGGAGSDYLAGDEGADIMRGGAGNDEYDVNEAGDQVIENDGGGHDEVWAEIDYTLTDNVEDLYLGGETYTESLSGTGNELDNYIEGNDGNNVLLGLAGNDVLYGGGGDDVMDGGAGDDTYYVDSELDVTVEAAGAGHDTVYSTVSHTLGDALEDLYLTEFDDIWGEGNALANLIVGNEGGNYIAGFEGDDLLRGEGGRDTLEGGEGNDRLEGSVGDDSLTGGEGDDVLDGGYDDDTMAGGLGDDAYYVDSDFDVVSEEVGEGTDTVFERVWYYQMGENIENAVMLGDFQDADDAPGYSIEGNALDNEITGNDNDNFLAGNDGRDTIDGRARNDYMYGGAGDDSLYGGDDAIRYQRQYIDSYGNVYSYDWGGLKPLDTVWGELASNSDELHGEEGDDTLDGGSGDDSLFGGLGNDYLYGGDDGLVADDAEGGGGGEEEESGGTGETDDGKVFLTNNDYLEGGDGDDVLDGGSGNDRLFGGEGNDTLLGGADGPLNRSNRDYLDGGAGIDFMAGGTDDDTYIVDGFFVETTELEVYDDCGELVPGAVTRLWTTDTVIEAADEGDDFVYSYADYTLPEHVEDLQLAWSPEVRLGRGNALDNVIQGNDFDNRLEGLAGDDTLYGYYGNDVLDGGAGDDWLYGGNGDDTYLFGEGYGHDIVVSDGGGLDVVHLAHGIAPGDVTLIRQGDSVVITLGGGDRMLLGGWFSQPTNRVRQILFCDDPAWDEATIAALANSRVDPVSAANDFAQVIEDSILVASGNVLGNDWAATPPLTLEGAGTYVREHGTFELAANGSYTFTLANDAFAVQSLAQGQTRQEVRGYDAVDGFGAYDNAALRVEIVGANDAPVFGPGTTGTVVEDAGGLIRYADGNLLYNGGFYFGLYDWALDGNADYSGWDYLAWEQPTAAYFGAIGSPALLSQEVEVFEGGRYLLEFDLLGGAPDGAEFSVSWNGATLLSVNDTGLEDEYRHYQVELDGVEGISRLEFSLRNDPGYWHLDDVRLGLLVEFENPPEFQQTSGALGFSDVDYSDWHVLSVQPRDENPLGAFDATFTSDSAYGEAGSVEWNFSVANGDLQFLAEGDTREQVYDLSIADDFGGTDTKSVTVTLRGVNDPLEAEDDWIALQEDGVLAVTGNAFDNDYELDLADALTVVEPDSFAGLYGTLDLAADGSYTYTLHNDSDVVQALNAGDFVEDVFEYAVTDGLAFNLPQLFVEIEGANDAPVALADAAEVEEDAVLFAQGNVLANDSDADAGSLIVVSTPGVYAGAHGSLTLGEDGGYVYALDNAAAQPLAGGQQMQEVFTYDVTDGFETASADLIVTVNGANDAPIAEDLTVIVSEDGPGVTLTPVYGDADAGSVTSLAVGAFSNAGFELGGFAGWQLSDAALGEVLSGGAPLGARYASLRSGAGQDAYTVLSRNFTLAAGESISGSAEFIAGDALPYDDDGYVSVRLLGGASTPLLGASVATVGDYGTSGWMPFEFVAPEAGTYVLEAGVRNAQDNSVDSRLNLDGMEQFRPAPGVTLNADGTIGYDPGGRFQWLAEGETASELFSYTVTDDQGAQAVATAAVQIEGANDAPEMGAGTTAASVVEDNTLPASSGLGAQGAIAFGDVDLSDLHQVQLGTLDSGYLGVFNAQLAVDTAGGGEGSVQWSFAVTNGELDALGEGETLEQAYEVLVEDAFGGSDERVVTVILVGTNDDPFAMHDAGAAQEDGGPVTLPGAALLANDTDADAGDTKTLIAVTDSAAGAQVTLAGGDAVYDVGGLFQTLKAGATAADSFSYTMVDAVGAASTATVAMTITGVNDAPVLVTPIADQNAAAGAPFTFTFAPNTFTDIDIGDTLAYSASLADGAALPSWLAFEAATRSFSGTPPGGAGGGTGEDCGCGTDGGSAPETLQLRVMATDTAGASASDEFVLNIAGGSSGGGIVPIVGTNQDDVISGTGGNDVIDGRKGYDRMSGGAGDDVYFVDQTCAKDGRHGNEGVGNGEDPPPPGHATNQNDGPGTSPGNPGRRGGGYGDDDDDDGGKCRVDLVVEGAVAGYDTVYSSASYTLPTNVEELHLIGREDLEGRGNALANMVIGNAGDNRLYGMAGNDLLLDDAGRDLLDGGDGDDVLDGGAGNDRLVGGKGNDSFVHAKGGGHDLVQDAGGQDAIRFGYGIAAGDVTVRRTGDDLLLLLSGGNGSVTAKDWFSSSSKRVEQVQFADGTVWNESAIRSRVTSGAGGEQGGYAGHYDGGQPGCDSGGRSDSHDDDHDDDHDGGHDDDERGGLFDAIAARLKRSPDYDFTALAVYLQRNGGGGYGAMTPEQIAQRWVQVQNCVGSLSQTDGDCGDGYGGKGNYGGYGCDDDRSHGGWGYSGSTGQNSGCGGMGTFSGLGEGFQKL